VPLPARNALVIVDLDCPKRRPEQECSTISETLISANVRTSERWPFRAASNGIVAVLVGGTSMSASGST
jgi:hypothetical protein